MVSIKEIDDSKPVTFMDKMKKIATSKTIKKATNIVSGFSRYTFVGARTFGNLLWILTTSAFVLLLPLRRAIDVEQSIMEAEAQQNGMYPMGGNQVVESGSAYPPRPE
eukprot:TRINITY_DN136540_c0_g1_i1.p1 TRINITY_DN136540_c0_g1~~TRINITY_DN136540_c0_g1_i1.p1  ORF type:complete len:108 (+),score=29.99 TRINITY_DN136540_c0_g1_i1:115-438(+)